MTVITEQDGRHVLSLPSLPIPANEEAEQGLLGALLLDNHAVSRVSGKLKAEHFYVPAHQRVYAAILNATEQGRAADPVALRPYFESDPDIEPGYLASLVANVVTVINAPEYARIVHDTYVRRCLVEVAAETIQAATTFDYASSGADQVDQAQQRIMALDDLAPAMHQVKTIGAAVSGAIERAEHAHRSGRGISGVTTGFLDLDHRIGGLQPSDLIVIGARPSMGKTDLGFGIAKAAASAHARRLDIGAGTLVFSLEMAAEQLGARYLADAVSVAADRQRRGELGANDFARMTQAVPDLPLWIDDTPNVSPAHILRVSKRVARTNPLGLIVVDHLAIMSPPDGTAEGETAGISAITRALKGVAKQLAVPLVLLAQLNRGVEMREDKRPMLADLRQSGTIEQDADVVMFLYRDEYYLERSEPTQRADEKADKYTERYDNWQRRLHEARGVAEVIIAKQRMGALGTVRLHYSGEFSRFSDLDQRH